MEKEVKNKSIDHNHKLQKNISKPRSSFLPPLQPLSINKPSVEKWPSAGCDDLGVWPIPQTPKGSIIAYDSGQNNKYFQLKKDKLAFFDKECSRISEYIYLGSETVAKNHELLMHKGITHVLNCVGFVCPEYFESDFVYKTLWLQDSPTEDITSVLYDVFDYFEDVREQGGRVLVHCCQGVSRSSSLVIAYLIWRNGQSFEDAFRFVKSARGVTNPNMGFAYQLLQCQKRVHDMPLSPNSKVRMYRMAPHSPYDPLHLVPKMVNQISAQALDSRGAFIVHVPSAIYVWIGKHCNSAMSRNAKAAAFQVIRYERAKGPILSILEGKEPPEFWIALSDTEEVKKEEHSERESIEIGSRTVDAYDLDFEIFHKAIAGGVVPSFSVLNAESETCIPAREHGWGRLRRKFTSGGMKRLFTSSKRNYDASFNDHCGMIMEEETVAEPLLLSSNSPCSSAYSFDCSETVNLSFSIPYVASSLPPSTPSSTLSSDYTSSSIFSPSSTNWSDLSFMSHRQSSPFGMESIEPFCVKDASFLESFSLLRKEVISSPAKAFLADHTLEAANYYMPSKKPLMSIAERRGSNPPPRMLLSLVNESPGDHKNMVRSQYFLSLA
ncbi:PREDICTED: protein-tyrosine-phosphatase MKP1-like [Lupinus angustifolius]|nr:PREDICTED: protein-tyrosine-phosphatase MKP1-like [Lupinus angustifolius]